MWWTSPVSHAVEYMNPCLTHPAEQSEPLLVRWRTSTRPRVLPVQVQTVKAMSPQELNG